MVTGVFHITSDWTYHLLSILGALGTGNHGIWVVSKDPGRDRRSFTTAFVRAAAEQDDTTDWAVVGIDLDRELAVLG